jgi:uncharacterized protein (DUF2342 family)
VGCCSEPGSPEPRKRPLLPGTETAADADTDADALVGALVDALTRVLTETLAPLDVPEAVILHSRDETLTQVRTALHRARMHERNQVQEWLTRRAHEAATSGALYASVRARALSGAADHLRLFLPAEEQGPLARS